MSVARPARRPARGLGPGLLVIALLGASGCPEPDSVELGAACKQEVECKDPADTCMTLGADTLCTMACSAEMICPEGYQCAKMQVRVEGADGADKAGAGGYCLADARVGSHVATIAPKGKAKRRAKRKARRERRSTPDPK